MAEAYGIDKVRILVLDDSSDDTVLEVDKIVSEYQDKSFNIEAQRRKDRSGFKAGAMQAALQTTGEEFIAIFDADFIPPADFLLRTIPYFGQDEQLGIVQSRWTHLNRDFNLLTKAISLGIDVHFFIEQAGRYASGCFQNFNGSGGVLRKKAVLDAGGWRADTLAEDLDLSYRMQSSGYRVLYLRDLECPGEIPPTVPSFKVQQGRWACGSLRNARKILPGLLHNRKLGVKQRLQAFIHLTGYMIHPLMVLSFVLSCLTVILGVHNLSTVPGTGVIHSLQALSWAVLLPLLVLCTLAPWFSLGTTLNTPKPAPFTKPVNPAGGRAAQPWDQPEQHAGSGEGFILQPQLGIQTHPQICRSKKQAGVAHQTIPVIDRSAVDDRFNLHRGGNFYHRDGHSCFKLLRPDDPGAFYDQLRNSTVAHPPAESNGEGLNIWFPQP